MTRLARGRPLKGLSNKNTLHHQKKMIPFFSFTPGSFLGYRIPCYYSNLVALAHFKGQKMDISPHEIVFY